MLTADGRKEVHRLSQEGLSTNHIARRLGVPQREVWRELAGFKFSVQDCFGCHEVISLASVDPGEDDTIPYRVDLPPRHRINAQFPDRVIVRCPEGVTSQIKWTPAPKWTPASEPPQDECSLECCAPRNLDTVEHETWLEYHDRLVREYFDGERKLLKEIYPERPKPAKRPTRTRRGGLHPYRGIAAAWTAVGMLNLMIGSTTMAVFWFTMGMVFLTLANQRGCR